jgi:hypothetical protein
MKKEMEEEFLDRTLRCKLKKRKAMPVQEVKLLFLKGKRGSQEMSHMISLSLSSFQSSVGPHIKEEERPTELD